MKVGNFASAEERRMAAQQQADKSQDDGRLSKALAIVAQWQDDYVKPLSDEELFLRQHGGRVIVTK